MRILLINSTCGTGSTGRICTDIAQEYINSGDECRIAYGRGNVPEKYKDIAVRIGNDTDLKVHGLLTRVFDAHGFGSACATRKFLKWADEYNPELLWLHNIHGYYINIELLFRWIKSRPDMQVKWTLHDFWTFTGHCTYFTMNPCSKWKTHCRNCPQKKEYPKSCVFDGSYRNYERKKKCFTGVKYMTLITPSEWLAGYVKQGFMKEYPVKVHYNRINTGVFKPTPGDFRKRYGIGDKKLILGVANIWDMRKGLKDFAELSKMLDDSYVIVLVGLTAQQKAQLPCCIIGIERTDSPEELAVIYTAADLFLNPSYEETFGMTTIEAAACGTDVIVYKGTACEEVAQKYKGIAVEPDVNALYKAVCGYFSDKQNEAMSGDGI